MSPLFACRQVLALHVADSFRRQNTAVVSAADKVFVAIALALEAETLQGGTAQRVAAAANHLLQIAGTEPNRILATLTPETQQTVRRYFA